MDTHSAPLVCCVFIINCGFYISVVFIFNLLNESSLNEDPQDFLRLKTPKLLFSSS